MTGPVDNAAMLAARVRFEIRTLRYSIERLERLERFILPPTDADIHVGVVEAADTAGGES
jgi:hypothetical protein